MKKVQPQWICFILLFTTQQYEECQGLTNVPPPTSTSNTFIHSKTLTSSSRHHDKIIQSPHIGYVTNRSKSLEVYVIGTSHFRCNSAKEVDALIKSAQPDGVVLELDPERVIRLTKQYAGFDEHGSSNNRGHPELLYGADFVAAVNAAQQLDIPLFLGDEYVQETKNRIRKDLFNRNAYSPVALIESIISSIQGDDGTNSVRMNILKTFAADPQKLIPLAISSSPPFLFASAIALFDKGGSAIAYDGLSLPDIFETILSILVSSLAVSFLFNSVIKERDEILAESTIKASKVLRSLKDNISIRKRWKFTVQKHEEKDESKLSTDSLPLFTLKTPLIKDAIRNLNLFEPRWLKMIDEVIRDKSTLDDDQVFGCVRCTNKFYSATSVNGEEGRYADIILEKAGTLARIKEFKEGKRPVSGDRKINVCIQGGDSFIVDESNLSVSNDGYMIASKIEPMDANGVYGVLSSQKETVESVRIVVVVGLLHGNGVIDLISKVW